MLDVDIPGWGSYHFSAVLFDLNGTLAQNGQLAASTRARLLQLGERLALYVISADTHGTLAEVTEGLPLQARRLQGTLGAEEKRRLVLELGAEHTIAVGNGRNDAAMLRQAALGIAILGAEGAAVETLLAADLVFPHIDDALESLLHPRRLLATLRG